MLSDPKKQTERHAVNDCGDITPVFMRSTALPLPFVESDENSGVRGSDPYKHWALIYIEAETINPIEKQTFRCALKRENDRSDEQSTCISS